MGYTIVVVGQVTALWGVVVFLENRKIQTGLHWWLLGFFALFWMGLEVWHRRYLGKNIGFVIPSDSITVEEFDSFVSKGRKLVVLEDRVLDVGEYSQWHPGGKFALDSYVGSDISRYFTGGYSHGPDQPSHAHSNYAR